MALRGVRKRRLILPSLVTVLSILIITGCSQQLPPYQAQPEYLPATATSPTAKAIATAATPLPSPTPTFTLTPLPALPETHASPSPTSPPRIVRPLPSRPVLSGEIRLGDIADGMLYPDSLAWLEGRLYAASRYEGRLAIVEGDRVVKNIQVCQDPVTMAPSSSTGRLFLACSRAKSIQIVKGEEVLDEWSLADSPRALAVSHDRLYVGLELEGTVLVLDMDGRLIQEVSFERPIRILALAIDEVSRRLIVCGYEQSLELDLDSLEKLREHWFKSFLTLTVDGTRGRWFINDYDSDSGKQLLAGVDTLSGEILGRAPIGPDPGQAVVHEENGLVYLASSWSDVVSIIDPTFMSVTGEILVGGRPTALAFDESGRILYVANRNTHNLAVIDVQKQQLAGFIPLAVVPSELEVEPERGLLLAAVPAMSSVLVFQDEEFTRALPVGIEPIDLALAPEWNRLYVASYADASLSVISLDTWESETVRLIDPPTALEVDQQRQLLYAGGQILSSRTFAAAGSLEVPSLTFIPTEPLKTFLDPLTGRLIILAHNGVPGSNSGYVIHALDGDTLKPLPGGLGGTSTTSILVDTAGRRVYSTAVRFGHYRLYVDDLDRLTRIAEIPLDMMPRAIALVPDHHHLYLALDATDQTGPTARRSGEVLLLDTRTLGEVMRWAIDEEPTLMTANPLTHRVYLAIGKAGRVQVFQDAPLPAPAAPTPTVTVTPWPAPTETPPSTLPPTAAASPTATPCAIAGILTPAWSADLQASLGCPRDVERRVFLAEQPFERGRMFWREDTQQIIVLFDNGQYALFDDLWAGPEEYSCAAQPPEDLIQPKRGFGKVWCEHRNVQELAGWATKEERGYDGLTQPYREGIVLVTDWNTAFLIFNDGTWLAISFPS